MDVIITWLPQLLYNIQFVSYNHDTHMIMDLKGMDKPTFSSVDEAKIYCDIHNYRVVCVIDYSSINNAVTT